MSGCRSLDTPMVSRGVISKNDSVYCCITKPELVFSVSHLCQFLSAPTDEHMKALKRVLIYLQGTCSYGLHLLKSDSLDIISFSYA